MPVFRGLGKQGLMFRAVPRRQWLVLVPVVVLVGGAALLFTLNPPPKVPPVLSEDPAAAKQPWVVKIHAQWCPVCLLTKGTWTKLQTAYAGRVKLLVFDVTNSATTQASRAEAKRLGLAEFFAAHGGEAGSVYVLDGVSKEVKDSVPGMSDLAVYAAGIDAALKAANN